MTDKILLTQCIADVGSLCINGIKFGNGIGDGVYMVYYAETLPDGFDLVYGDVWIDLRDTDLRIWHYDCETSDDDCCISRNDDDCPINANALQVARNKYGDICLVKYF